MKENKKRTGTLKLNLVLTYPVKWTVYEVFRDFIQNFFDAVGPEEFGKKFTYTYDKDTRILTMASISGFALDWLLYIGVSSKRDSGRNQVGKFGEGFKIASLAGYRDFGWDIVMESRDWRIHVTEAADEIGDQEVKVLAYEKSARPYSENSVLTINGVSEEEMKTFQEALFSFWYPENPSFGEKIAERFNYAIYRTPDGRGGALYAGYLRRAHFSEPVIVCNHSYKAEEDGRDREDYYTRDITRCITDIIRRMSSTNAGAFLEALKSQWSQRHGSKGGSYDWNDVIFSLIERVAENDKISRQFKEYYGDKLIADFPRESYGNKRAIALQWRQANEEFRELRLVYSEFEILGIENLDNLCRRHGGYETLRQPTAQEAKYLDILRRISKDIFAGFTCYEKLPRVRIIANRPLQAGSAYSRAVSGRRRKNVLGLSVQAEIRSIQIRAMLLAPGQFSQAVTVFMHELLHQFGGDSSAKFRTAITAMSLQMIRKADLLTEYEREWEQAALSAKETDYA